MARHISKQDLKAIEDAVRAHPNGVSAQEISNALQAATPLRTVQYHLKHLVDHNYLVKESEGRWTKYHLPAAEVQPSVSPMEKTPVPLSPAAAEIRAYVKQPITNRNPVGYNWAFLNAYRPNVTLYFSEQERAHLRQIGTPLMSAQPAGSYAKQIMSRLLIDLSWNSSRLEGNTYSLLDTKRLIAFGQEAEGKEPLETQMILNHKDAIEFLIDCAEEITFNRRTIFSLHTLLADNLLPDPTAPGRLRRIPVGIGKSVYHPLQMPQLIEEYFDQILATAAAINDPFEQALFVMVQLPYLQPFDDVNKRTSRLAANIPLIKKNLVPLSFTDVPRETYNSAILGVYELNKTELLKDVFIWAYEQSVARHAIVRQVIGEPDPFRLRYRLALREVIAEIIRGCMTKKQALAHLATWTQHNIDAADNDKFKETVEDQLLSLHEGNFASYRIRPAEFAAWQEVWK